VDAVVVPESACGGSALLSWGHLGKKIIAVADNQTRMRVYPKEVGLSAWRVSSYLEAIGALVAHRSGIDPQSLRSGDVLSLQQLP
jgi:hypothetical protein